MDGQPFTGLFKSPMQIKLESHRNNFTGYHVNGCYITIKATPAGKKIYQEIGSIIVFHHNNALNLYQKAKQEFADNKHVLYQPKIFPFIEDGFIDNN